MRVLPPRPVLADRPQKRLRNETAEIEASLDQREAAERKYANARKAKGFRGVIEKLGELAGPGEPCMFCDANESTDVEHYRPKRVFPQLALVWENLLWACTNCNRFKLDRFPPDTEPGARLLNPVEDNVWEHFFIDQFGTLTPAWRPHLSAFEPRAVSTREILRLDRQTLHRQTLQERRLLRLRGLKRAAEDTVARYRSNQLTLDEVKQRIEHWKVEPFQADVADYFLNGPGRTEEPFAALLTLI